VVRDNSGLSVQSGFSVFFVRGPILFSDFGLWFIWVVGIGLITGGLIVTFKDRKPKDEEKNK